MDELFLRAEEWVYGDYADKPSEQVYDYLVAAIGDLPALYNIANDWGYLVPASTMEKIQRLWVEYFRPDSYIDRALRARKMTENEYMMYMYSLYMVPKYLKGEAYTNYMSLEFPQPDAVMDKWVEYVDGLPEDINLEWEGIWQDLEVDRTLLTPISSTIAQARFSLLNTIIDIYMDEGTSTVTIDDTITQSYLERLRDIYPRASAGSIVATAIQLAPHRIDPETSNLGVQDAIGIWFLYDILGASSSITVPLDKIIAQGLTDSTVDEIGILLSRYEGVPNALEATREAYNTKLGIVPPIEEAIQ